MVIWIWIYFELFFPVNAMALPFGIWLIIIFYSTWKSLYDINIFIKLASFIIK